MIKTESIVPLLHDECSFAFAKEIGSDPSWVSFSAASLVSRIMHRATSRLLMGPEVCRDTSYLRLSQTFTDSIFVNGLILSMLPLWPLRYPLSYVLSVFHRYNLRRAMKIVVPIVTARFEEFRRQQESNNFRGRGADGDLADDQLTERHLDAIEWTLQLSKELGQKEHNPYRISLSLLHNLWAGSAAPAGLLTQMLFKVLLDPPSRYLEPLRAEAEAAIKQYGCTDKTLSSMPLLDSFIREMNRLYPTGSATCARTIMDPAGFAFHDGLKLPVGTKIVVPALAIQTDDRNFDNPLEFQGFRFVDLGGRNGRDGTAGVESNWGASTISESNLA